MRKTTFLGLLFALVLATAGAAAAGTQAGAWNSNWFVSPTHNIHCRWYGDEALIACTSQNDNFMVGVTVWGRAWHKRSTGSRAFPDGPTLAYGDTWTARNAKDVAVIRCWSKTDGMRCKSLMTGHGFFLNREEYGLY